MDERELVIAAIEGDEGAFVKLYEIYYKKLYRYAVFTLRTKEDAEDAVSEAITDAYAGISQLRNPQFFGTWLFRILSNKCKNKMKDYYVTDDTQAEIKEEGIEPDYTENMWLNQVMSKLLPKERTVIGMCVLGGYDSKVVGEILHMNPSTVRSIRKRTLDKLANQLKE